MDPCREKKAAVMKRSEELRTGKRRDIDEKAASSILSKLPPECKKKPVAKEKNRALKKGGNEPG